MAIFDDVEVEQTQVQIPSTLPKELQGKTADEMYQILQAEHLKEIAIKEAAAKKQLDDQKAVFEAQKKEELSQQVSQPAPQSQQLYPQSDDITNFYTNPSQFMDQQLTERLGPITENVTQSIRALNAESSKRKEDPKFVEKYWQDVETFVNTLAPALRSRPDAYTAAVSLVKGQHQAEIINDSVDAIVAAKVAEALSQHGIAYTESGSAPPSRTSLFQQPIGVPPGNKQTQQRTASPKLTPEEIATARLFGMTAAEYSEYK